MAKVCSVREMRIVEENAKWLGVSEELMMENAGAAVARAVEELAAPPARVAVLAGVGGKAGDGLVAARHLALKGYRVDVLFVESARRIAHPAARMNYSIVSRMLSIRVRERYGRWINSLSEYDVLVDAMLGTGFRPPLSEPYLTVIVRANSIDAVRVAIDVPSGVEPDTGSVEPTAFKADVTVTMHCPKPGLYREPGRSYAGRVVVADIGVPPEAEKLVGPGDVKYRLPPPDPRGHKGVNGRVLVVGGSREYHGAPWLTAIAALEAGADLVYLAAPKTVLRDAYSPEIIPMEIPGERLQPAIVERLAKTASGVDVVVIGPGMGREPETLEAFTRLLRVLEEMGARLVLDADALYALSASPRPIQTEAVLTPHLGEASRLLGSRIPDTLEDRVKAAREAAARYNAVVLLKGWVDVVASPHGKYRLNVTGTPQMTVGGTGDVLAGVLAALWCRVRDPYIAACLAAYVTGAAGRLAEEKYARVTALRVAGEVPRVLRGEA